MIYLVGLQTVVTVACFAWIAFLWSKSQRETYDLLQDVTEIGRQERHQLQTQLLAMVADPRTAVVIARSQELDEDDDELKGNYTMGDAEMKDHERRIERQVLAGYREDDDE